MGRICVCAFIRPVSVAAGAELCWGELGRPPQLNLGVHKYICFFSDEVLSSDGRESTTAMTAVVGRLFFRRRKTKERTIGQLGLMLILSHCWPNCRQWPTAEHATLTHTTHSNSQQASSHSKKIPLQPRRGVTAQAQRCNPRSPACGGRQASAMDGGFRKRRAATLGCGGSSWRSRTSGLYRRRPLPRLGMAAAGGALVLVTESERL
jgi:hypothetical protein